MMMSFILLVFDFSGAKVQQKSQMKEPIKRPLPRHLKKKCKTSKNTPELEWFGYIF